MTTVFGLQAEDLKLENLTADSWNSVLDDGSELISQFIDLGMDIA